MATNSSDKLRHKEEDEKGCSPNLKSLAMDLTKLFLIKKFREYYERNDIELPKEFEKREFAIVPLESSPDFFMIRH